MPTRHSGSEPRSTGFSVRCPRASRMKEQSGGLGNRHQEKQLVEAPPLPDEPAQGRAQGEAESQRRGHLPLGLSLLVRRGLHEHDAADGETEHGLGEAEDGEGHEKHRQAVLKGESQKTRDQGDKRRRQQQEARTEIGRQRAGHRHRNRGRRRR